MALQKHWCGARCHGSSDHESKAQSTMDRVRSHPLWNSPGIPQSLIVASCGPSAFGFGGSQTSIAPSVKKKSAQIQMPMCHLKVLKTCTCRYIYIYVYVYIYIYTHEMISLDFFRTPRPYMTQLNEAPALYCTWKVAGPPHTAQHQTNQSDFVTPIIRVTQRGGSKLKGSHQLKTTTATTTTSTTKLWRIGKP